MIDKLNSRHVAYIAVKAPCTFSQSPLSCIWCQQLLNSTQRQLFLTLLVVLIQTVSIVCQLSLRPIWSVIFQPCFFQSNPMFLFQATRPIWNKNTHKKTHAGSEWHLLIFSVFVLFGPPFSGPANSARASPLCRCGCACTLLGYTECPWSWCWCATDADADTSLCRSPPL